MLTQEELKKELEYDNETGLFRWREIKHGNRKRGWFAGSRQSHGYRVIYIQRVPRYAHFVESTHKELHGEYSIFNRGV